MDDVKNLSAKNTQLKTNDVIELVKAFAGTWFSLESNDEQTFPQKGLTKIDLEIHP